MGAKKDREPLIEKSASERVSDTVSEREGSQRFSEVFQRFCQRQISLSEALGLVAPNCVAP